MKGMRVYRIDSPSAPREPEGKKVWSNGVVRTVAHDGAANIVTWDYRNDKHS